MQLVYGKEKSLFAISLIISLLVWAVALVGTMGVLLLWVLAIFVLYLFTHSAFISYLKGTAVKVTENQYPDLYEAHKACCEKLEMKTIPDMYLLSADGILNALATRFLGRNFVVLFSNIVDALESRPEAVKFYIGHELGHIKQKHLLYGPLLFPASILPLIGAAYSRAREYTCDLHGLACSNNKDDAMYSMAVLAAGEKRWQTINMQSYLGQVAMTGDFWMSFHELLADYPWLSKRLSRIDAIANGTKAKSPRRSFFAWFFALFIPRLGMGASGGVVSIFVFVAIIGILAAIAIPAYQGYINKAHVAQSMQSGNEAKALLEDYIINNNQLPNNLKELGFSNSATDVADIKMNEEGGIVITFTSTNPSIGGETLIIKPYVEEQKLYWRCDLGTLDNKFRPAECLPVN